MGEKKFFPSIDYKNKRLSIPQTLCSLGAEKDNGEL